MLLCNSSSISISGQAAILIGSQRGSSPAVAHRLAGAIFRGATVKMKICNECLTPKVANLTEFYSDASKSDKLTTRCRICVSAGVAHYRETHRDILKANSKRDRDECPERGIWRQIISRCTNPNNPSYYNYGERGITVCQGFRSFENFYGAVESRPTKEHSIDRRDNDGNYSCGECDECLENGWPMNLRWATPTEQAYNTRRTRILTVNGVSLPAKQWAGPGISAQLIYCRLHNGWTDEDAVLTPRHSLRKRRI